MFLAKRIFFIRNFTTCSQVLRQQAKPKDAPKDKNVFFHDAYNINYKKLQINDKELSSLILMVKSKKKLYREQQIVVEGNQLITEAVESHLKLNYLLFSHIEKVADVVNIMGGSTGNVAFIKVPQQDLSHYSVLTTCPGLIGIFQKPNRPKPKENALPITVLCDNIREPNNLGAVIRLCNALPASMVLLPKGCADPWDVKAIRGSSGSIFHMPTEDSLTWQQIDQSCDDMNSIVLIADNDVSKYRPSTVVPYDNIPLELIEGRNIILMLGGETHGISEDARNFAYKRNSKVVHIPLDPTCDSLNTSNALAIILFELRRKLTSLQ